MSMIPNAISREVFQRHIEKRYRDNTVIIHRTIGSRSGKYARKLLKNRINPLYLKGSTLAWIHAGNKVVDADGHGTRRVHVYGNEWDLLPEGYEALW